ncbi:glycosyltransferase family 4 protein [Flavobacterium sp. '19STA2R22 D10 B1']|uniref:glycosyltransferase family 4 protein n=1 Tax=Flavobacterium aerium TaxID=3037261 RepID=UPI00278BB7B8|nr:glycosyltransferase family 1 protein [Flavobacterium sp. '19STA2R22 D10 B1']
MNYRIFLETHNLKNKASGLGTFNHELIKGLSHQSLGNLDLYLNVVDPKVVSEEFGTKFKYHKCYTLNRYPFFRIRRKHDLWHSVNQNTKIEPHRVSKYLLTVHDVNFFEEISSDINHPKNKLFIEKLNRANAITYISEFAKKQTHQHFKVPNIPEYVIHNGNPITDLLDTKNYTPSVPIEKPFLYSIGDFLERKNFLSLVEMMPYLPDYNLVLSGNNNKSYGRIIEKFIQENQLENQVFLTGKVDDTGKQYYMKNCAAFVFPSIREGFGLPPIEAMRFGKPIFLSDKTSLPEIGGEYSFYWKEFNPEYMAATFLEGLQKYNTDFAFYSQKYIERALSFSWDTAAKKYIEVYRSLLEK